MSAASGSQDALIALFSRAAACGFPVAIRIVVGSAPTDPRIYCGANLSAAAAPRRAAVAVVTLKVTTTSHFAPENFWTQPAAAVAD